MTLPLPVAIHRNGGSITSIVASGAHAVSAQCRRARHYRLQETPRSTDKAAACALLSDQRPCQPAQRRSERWPDDPPVATTMPARSATLPVPREPGVTDKPPKAVSTNRMACSVVADLRGRTAPADSIADLNLTGGDAEVPPPPSGCGVALGTENKRRSSRPILMFGNPAKIVLAVGVALHDPTDLAEPTPPSTP